MLAGGFGDDAIFYNGTKGRLKKQIIYGQADRKR